MAIVYQVRGTNGSGKSTLVRSFIHRPNDQPQDILPYPSPTKADPQRKAYVQGHWGALEGLFIVGSYRTACGGLDSVPSFQLQQDAIAQVALRGGAGSTVLCEGVLASTVFGSWGAFAERLRLNGHSFVFIYLNTPLEVCLQRISARQRAAGKERPIKEDLVADKIKAVRATRTRALEAGHTVFDIPYDPHGVLERQALRMIIGGEGEVYRAEIH